MTLDEPYRLLDMSAAGDDVPGKGHLAGLREAGASRVSVAHRGPEAVARGLRQALRSCGVARRRHRGHSAVPLIDADLVVMVERRGGDLAKAPGGGKL